MAEARVVEPGTAKARDPGVRPMDHIVPVWMYLLIYVLLLGFTALTVVAAYVDLGLMNNVVALGIAVAKATLVALVFMHLRWSTPLVFLIAGAGLFWVVHLMGGTFGDYFTRGLIDVPGK